MERSPAKARAVMSPQTVFEPWNDPHQKPLIRFQGVTKRFGDFTAIDNIDLDLSLIHI